MRQLQVVGISDDGEALLLGQGAGKPSHRLRLDDKLRAAVRGQLAAVGDNRRAESALTPKEMQARLREGASPEEVAKEAGIPVARVLPYAAPVIAERERIVEQARTAVLHRSRGPNGERPLGEVVDAHLNDTAGFKPDSVDWTARRRRDGAWVVVLAYVARGGRRTASWLWRPLERDLTSLDASGTRLATEETSTPRRRVAKPAAKPAKKAAAKKKSAPKARKASRRPAAKKAAPAAKKAAVKRAAATRTAPKRATKAAKPAKVAKPVKAAAATTAVAPRRAKTAPVAKRVKAAPAVKPAKATRKPAKPVRTRRPVRAVASVEDVALTRPTVVPDPVIEPLTEAPAPPVIVIPRPEPEPEPEPEVQAEPIVARRPGQRVPLPSWSDVLLGVSPPDNSRDAGTKRPRKSG